MRSIHRRLSILNITQLNAALRTVVNELDLLGLWQDSLSRVQVSLGDFSTAYGYIHEPNDYKHEIVIPMFSISRLQDAIGFHKSRPCPVVDVLRHEYGHALADIHPRLTRSHRFIQAFDYPHDCLDELEYNPQIHFTEYSATSPSEDFAETFMLFIKHKSQLPKTHRSREKTIKWNFIRDFIRQIGHGRTRW